MHWRSMDSAPKDGTRILVNWLYVVEIATFNTEVGGWQQWPDGDFDTGFDLYGWMPLPDEHTGYGCPEDCPIRTGLPSCSGSDTAAG